MDVLKGTVAWALLVATAVTGACREEPTQLLVVVDSDMAVPAELDGYRIGVTGADGPAYDGTFPAAGTSKLPASFGVRPRKGRSDRSVTVRVTALREGATLFETTAVTGFVANQRLRLDIFLSKRCVETDCVEPLTCRDGACVEPEIDPHDLPPYDPRDPLRTTDAGVPGDAGTDAGGSCPEPCGLWPECGCGAQSVCLEVAPDIGICVDECQSAEDCGPPGICTTDNSRPAGPANVGTCVVDCDPVGGAGCPEGVGCRAINLYDAARDVWVIGPACEAPGSAAMTEACTLDIDCDAQLGCDKMEQEATGACAPYCRSDADCAGTPCSVLITLEGEPSDWIGRCPLPCDPIENSGCGDGLECMLMQGRAFGTGTTVASPGCRPLSDVPLGAPCGVMAWCEPKAVCVDFGAGSTCHPACRMQGSDCTAGSTCYTIGARLGDTEYGACFP